MSQKKSLTRALKSRKLFRNFWFQLGLVIALLCTPEPCAIAKPRPPSSTKSKNFEVNLMKDISGEAHFTTQQNLVLPAELSSWQFQNGQISSEIDFFKTPRCYLHFKSHVSFSHDIPSGLTMKVNKIDNIYHKGSVHVTFWFDESSLYSDLLCITNSGHTPTVSELKTTLGDLFQITLTNSVETDALFNTAPDQNARVLSEDSSLSESSITSARLILSGT